MWKIDNRTSFLTFYNGFLGERNALLLQMFLTSLIIITLSSYIPETYFFALLSLMFILFLGRWKSIDQFLALEDREDLLPTASKRLKKYVIWLFSNSLFNSILIFMFIDSVPKNYQLILFVLLIILFSTAILSTMNFLNVYLVFIAPLILTLLFIAIKNRAFEYQILSVVTFLLLIFSIRGLKIRRELLTSIAQKIIDTEKLKEHINLEIQNLKKYINASDELEVGTILIDNKNRIIYHSMTIEKWFPVEENMNYDRFFASVIRDINELNKQEIISKSGRNYKISSRIIKDIDGNMYYLKLFKDTTKEYVYNKVAFREMALVPAQNESDRLTRLLTRDAFFKYLEQATYEADVTSTKLAFIIVNINDFDYIAEAYGKKVANDVLTILSKRLRNSTRDSDLVGRYESNELVVGLKLMQDIETIEIVAKKILKNLIRPFRIIDEKDIFITINMGISVYPDNTKDIYKLEEQAYIALMEIKKYKKSGYMFFRDVISVAVQIS